MIKKALPILLKIIAAFIMGQTLFFKFFGAEESINLFTTIAGDNEALMRIGTGVLELIAVVLLFIPNKTWLGAFLTLGLMGGAIVSHLTILGIEFNGDGGALFISAVITFLSAFIILILNKKEIPFLRQK